MISLLEGYPYARYRRTPRGEYMYGRTLQMRSSAHEGKKEPPLPHKYNCLFPFPSSDPIYFKLRRSTLPLPWILSYSPPLDSLHDMSSNARVRVMSCFPDIRCA